MSYQRKRRLKRKKSPIPLLLMGSGLIVVAIAIVIFLPKENPSLKVDAVVSPIPGEVNFQAPELALENLGGDLVTLAELRGQVVLVNNWATWCPPCRAEMPELEAYFRAHVDEGFLLVAINSGDTQEQVTAFVEEYDLTFPMWLDPTGLALREFKNNALPSSYVVDKSGTVRFVWTGAVSTEALETYVTPLLAE